MIVGELPFGLPSSGECFRELDDALRALGRGDVALNAHRAPWMLSPQATVWNLERAVSGVPVGVDLGSNQVRASVDTYRGHELWDYSIRNCAVWRSVGRPVRHVPVGYHPSMERFRRSPDRDIDVLHLGALSPRRRALLSRLQATGARVVHVPHALYGRQRDAILGRARLCVAPLYFEGGLFPSLRAAHLASNRIPLLSESCEEAWPFLECCPYEEMFDAAMWLLKRVNRLGRCSDAAYEGFRAMPLEGFLPPTSLREAS